MPLGCAAELSMAEVARPSVSVLQTNCVSGKAQRPMLAFLQGQHARVVQAPLRRRCRLALRGNPDMRGKMTAAVRHHLRPGPGEKRSACCDCGAPANLAERRPGGQCAPRAAQRPGALAPASPFDARYFHACVVRRVARCGGSCGRGAAGAFAAASAVCVHGRAGRQQPPRARSDQCRLELRRTGGSLRSRPPRTFTPPPKKIHALAQPQAKFESQHPLFGPRSSGTTEQAGAAGADASVRVMERLIS